MSTVNLPNQRLLQYFFIIGTHPDKPLIPILSDYGTASLNSVDSTTTSSSLTPRETDGNDLGEEGIVRTNEPGTIHSTTQERGTVRPLINPKRHDVGPLLLLDRYPSLHHHTDENLAQSLRRVPLPEGIINLAFPTGYRIRRGKEGTEPLPQYYTSVLCNEYGQKYYGHFLILYETLTSTQSCYLDPSIIEPLLHDGTLFFVPKCIGFYSSYNYPIIRYLLTTLYRYSITPNQTVPLERLIQWMIMDIPVPPSGYIDIHIPLVHNEMYRLRAPPRNARISALNKSTDLRIMMECLSLINIIYILFYGLMLENQIIFVSSQLSLLTTVTESFLTLLYPFRWLHPYIPILPKACSEFLQMPTPFMVGIEAHIFTTLEKNGEIPPYVLIVRLDNNSLSFSKPMTNDDNGSEANEENGSRSNIIHPYDSIFNPSVVSPSSTPSSGSSFLASLTSPSKPSKENSSNTVSGNEYEDYGWNSLPPLPSNALRILLNSLHRIGNAYYYRSIDWTVSTLPMMDSAFSFSLRPGEFDNEGDKDYVHDDGTNDSYVFWKEESARHVRAEACSCPACTQDQHVLNDTNHLTDTIGSPRKMSYATNDETNPTTGTFCAAGVRHAFFRYFLSLLYKYQYSFKQPIVGSSDSTVDDTTPNTNDHNVTAASLPSPIPPSSTLPQFLPELFLQQTFSENRPYLREFFHTQMWNDFIDFTNPYQLFLSSSSSGIPKNATQPSDTVTIPSVYDKEEYLDALYLKESMDRFEITVKNGLFSFTQAISTTSILSPPTVSTPFLDSHMDDFLTTVTLSMPDTTGLPDYPQRLYSYKGFPITLDSSLFSNKASLADYLAIITSKNIHLPTNHRDIRNLYPDDIRELRNSKETHHTKGKSSLVSSLLSLYNNAITSLSSDTSDNGGKTNESSSSSIFRTSSLSARNRVLTAWKQWTYKYSSSKLAQRIRAEQSNRFFRSRRGSSSIDDEPTKEGLRYHNGLTYPFTSASPLLLPYYTVWFIAFILHMEHAKAQIAQEVTERYNQSTQAPVVKGGSEGGPADSNENVIPPEAPSETTVDFSLTINERSNHLYQLIKNAQDTYLHHCFDILFAVLHRMKVYDRVSPDELIYRICVETCAVYGEFDYGYLLLNEMMTMGYLVDSKLVKLLYSAYTAKNLFEENTSSSSAAGTSSVGSTVSDPNLGKTNPYTSEGSHAPQPQVNIGKLNIPENFTAPIVLETSSYAPSWWYNFQRSRWYEQRHQITPRKGSVMDTQRYLTNDTYDTTDDENDNIGNIEEESLQIQDPQVSNVSLLKASASIYKGKQIRPPVRKPKHSTNRTTTNKGSDKKTGVIHEAKPLPSRPSSSRLSAPATMGSVDGSTNSRFTRNGNDSDDEDTKFTKNNYNDTDTPNARKRRSSVGSSIIADTSDTISGIIVPVIPSLPQSVALPPRLPSSGAKIILPQRPIRPGSTAAVLAVQKKGTNPSTAPLVPTSSKPTVPPPRSVTPNTAIVPVSRSSSETKPSDTGRSTTPSSFFNRISTWAESVFDTHMTGDDGSGGADSLSSLMNMDPSLVMAEAPSEWQQQTTSATVSTLAPVITKSTSHHTNDGSDNGIDNLVGIDSDNDDEVETNTKEEEPSTQIVSIPSTTDPQAEMNDETSTTNSSFVLFERLAYNTTSSNDTVSSATTASSVDSTTNKYTLTVLSSSIFPSKTRLRMTIDTHTCPVCRTVYTYNDIYNIWLTNGATFQEEILTFCPRCFTNVNIRLDTIASSFSSSVSSSSSSSSTTGGAFQPYMNIDYPFPTTETALHPIEWLSPYTLVNLLHQEYSRISMYHFASSSSSYFSSSFRSPRSSFSSSSDWDPYHGSSFINHSSSSSSASSASSHQESLFATSSVLFWNVYLLCHQLHLPLEFLRPIARILYPSMAAEMTQRGPSRLFSEESRDNKG